MKNLFHVFLRMFTKFLGERPSKLAISLCVALFASTTAFAEEYITDVMVIGGDKDRVDFLKDSCRAQGWTVIDKDLNDNAGVGTDYVYLLYKKSSEGNASNGFITDFIIKTDEYPDSYIFNGRTYYRIPHKGSEHFEIHGGNLNSGTVSSSTNMRLYYTKEEFPDRRFVRDIAFTDAKLKSGYTTLGRNGAVVGSDGSGAMDLNEGAGSSSDYIYMHFATVSSSMDNPEYISDVVVLGGSKGEVNALKERYASRGWIVIDQDLNDNAGAGTDYIYMAYKKSHFSDVNKGFITDFIIKTGDHPDSFTFNGRTYYRAPNFGDGNFAIYGGNLNSGTVSSSTNMWLYFTRESFPDTRVVSDIAFTVDEKTLKGYTTLGENGAAVGSDGSGAMDLNEGAGSSSDYIYMHFATAPSYVNITFVTGLENVSVPSQTVVSGLTPTKPSDPKRSGLKFVGWYADETFTTEFDFSAPVTSNTTVYAKWEASVTFVTGVENVSVPTQTIVFGNTPTKPSDPECSGLKFAGWYADESFTTEFNFSAPVTSNTAVYVKWEASVTFVTGVENVSVPTQTIVFGNTPTKPADLERSGFTFMGWYTTANGTTQFDFSAPVTNDVSVYARWAHLVTFVTGDANVVVPTQLVFVGEAPAKPSDPERSGFKFLGWYADESFTIEFDFSAPVTSNITVYAKWWNGDLSMLTIEGSYVAEDGYVLMGELASNSKISIANNAAVTLDGVTINGYSNKNDKYEWAGITCLGNCTIVLKGKNSVKGFWEDYPGIHVLEGGTLTIEGGENDTLYASSNGWAPGIGGGFEIGCGNINIMGGVVFATGGKNSAGIGLGEVRDGVVTSCGDITIASGVTRVTARGGDGAPYSIGIGTNTGSGQSSVGKIIIDDEVTGNISTSPFTFPKKAYTVVFDKNGGDGAMVDQTLYIGYEEPLSRNLFTREKYVFVGWNTDPNGNGVAYDDGTMSDLTDEADATVTLYAQWLEVEENVINLRNLTKNSVVQDGDLLTGTLGGNYKISIADGATVTLYGVTINGVKNGAYKWAGITCEGDCKIILKGENSVKGFYENYPGIYVPERKTLTVEGDGSLDASSNGFGAGIGGGDGINCGNIVINDGTVTATGGQFAAGIGSGYYATAGDITIGGGSVTATGGLYAAGIGSGYYNATAGSITIGGGSVTATGGSSAAGIGSGYLASAGDITITDGVTLVTANKGERSPNSVGLGDYGKSVGKISIGGVFVDGVSTSPFTYPANDLYTYTIVFDANGGEGTMSNQKMFLGISSPLSANVFTRSNHIFVGWNTKADGSGTSYADGASVLNLTAQAGASVTLYAQWLEGNVVNLKDITNDFVVQDGYLLTGKPAGNYKVSIADGATVTLDGVTINGVNQWAGLTCKGDCKIILKGENTVKGFHSYYPGIYVPEGKTLTVEGDGSLDASSNGWGAGIGGGDGINCGNIVINAGTVTATGGESAAGIGSGEHASAGSITISGGTVTATGGQFAAGIGSGYFASAGDITITDGVTLVTANKGERSPNSVGLGIDGKSVGKISIGGVFVDGISESPYTFQTYDVVFDANGGTGNMEKQHFVYDAEPKALAKNTFTREGYTFVGWNTKADGSGTTYADEAKVQNLTDEAGGKVTLYAQWGMPYIDGNGKEQIKQSGEYIVLTGTTDVSTLSSGWYVVMGEVTYENSFDFAGKDVHLILADGAKLTVVNNRADAKTEFNNLTIYAQSKDDKMGAFVVNSSNGDAIKVGENFVINGGVVTAAGSVDAKVFLAGGTVKANGYKGSVSVKDGLFYTDGKGNSYTAGENGSINVVDFNGENVTSSFSLNMIAGKNMHPYIPAIQFKKYVKSDGSEGTLAELNANYNEIVPFGISEEMTVDSVEFKREFTTVENGYATVLFPFDVQANNLEGVETIVAFAGVNAQYQVMMNVVWKNEHLTEKDVADGKVQLDYTLEAHTPYMVHMSNPTLTIHGPVTLKPIEKDTYEIEIGNWKFIGTYVFKVWSADDKDLNHAYGYTTVSSSKFNAGEFVIIAKNAITRAFRAYLVETQPQAIAARKPFQNNVGAQTVLSSSYSTPEYMEVVIIDKDEEGKEHTTVIGRFNTRTGEIKLNPVGNRVYDLKGRFIRKDAKKAKGVYYGKNAAR